MPKPRAKTPAVAVETRPVLYPELACRVAVGQNAITVEQAKELLGWEETEDAEKTLLRDRNGKRIHCRNNVENRPLYASNYERLVQNILRGRWRFNFENIIVTRTGRIRNGQHSLIALILAEQDRLKDDELRKKFPQELTLEKSVGYGISDDQETANTMDTAKPRSLGEVIAASPYFASFKKKSERIKASRIAEHAIKLLWYRTGFGNAFGLKQTHSESIDFLNNHAGLLECVKLVFVENGDDNKVARYLSPGYASGLLYLMAASDSNGDKYYDAEVRSQELLSLKRMNKASEFLVLLVGGSPELRFVRDAIGRLASEQEGTGGTLDEKMGILIKAWNLYKSGEVEFYQDDPRLKLVYFTDPTTGVRKLTEFPLLGGIDREQVEKDDEEDTPEEEDDPLEIEAAKEQIKAEAIAKTRDAEVKAKPTPTPKKTPKQILDEKREAEARAADAMKKTPKTPTPAPRPAPPAASSNGFKAPPTPKPRPPLPAKLRGGIGS